ncbi:MAG: hypothetical protein AB7P03_01790 [Kofleriaceae bacterium]
MNPSVWCLFIAGPLALIACGGNGESPRDSGIVPFDSGIDAPLEYRDCPVTAPPSACNATAAPTAVASNTQCDALTHTGCQPDEKCTWIMDQANPYTGHLGCAPAGTVQDGCACTTGGPGGTGYDDCAKGSFCVRGTCARVCDLEGASPACGDGTTCTRYADVFRAANQSIAGLCDPTCDPLTQCETSATPNACGSTNGAQPDRGCYGFDETSCGRVDPATLSLTDRKAPLTTMDGEPRFDGCAPGFMAFFLESTASMTTLCSGLCAAADTDSTPALAVNEKGDPNAFGKLPGDVKPAKGHATCDIGVKGSELSSVCVFAWQFALDDDGELLITEQTADKLGICMAVKHFKYDADGNGFPEADFPACGSLPPRSSMTTGPFDDAMDWGCYDWTTMTSSALRARSARPRSPLAGAVRIGLLKGDAPLTRHVLE